MTHFPCINCAKALINAGIARLIYHVAYRVDENALEFLQTANIEIVHLNNDLLRLADPAYNHTQRPDEGVD